jgi:hypothetical protein
MTTISGPLQVESDRPGLAIGVVGTMGKRGPIVAKAKDAKSGCTPPPTFAALV